MLTFLCVVALLGAVVAIGIAVSAMLDINEAIRAQREVNDETIKLSNASGDFMKNILRWQEATTERIELTEQRLKQHHDMIGVLLDLAPSGPEEDSSTVIDISPKPEEEPN